jgi:hypothetical protein
MLRIPAVASPLLVTVVLSAAFISAKPATASAGDLAALSQGFKDAEPCNAPFAKSHDMKAFTACVEGVEAKYKGTMSARQSYVTGAGFNAWSLADALADATDKDLFPDIKSRAKASKERRFAMQLFSKFRGPQKQQKISDADLAKLVGADPESLTPILDYYDHLPLE